MIGEPLFYNYIFYAAIPMGWILSLFVQDTYFYTLIDVLALQQIRAATFQIFRWSPFTFSPEPAS